MIMDFNDILAKKVNWTQNPENFIISRKFYDNELTQALSLSLRILNLESIIVQGIFMKSFESKTKEF